MATGTLPDAGQILNSLINSILLVDDDLAVHYANPAAQQLLAQSSRKLFGTPLPELLSYFSLNIGLMQESLLAGQGFTDNEVTLVIDGRSHILSLTAQRLPEGYILLEMAPMDNQRRLSQEQLQHAQQIAARDLVRGLAHEIKNPLCMAYESTYKTVTNLTNINAALNFNPIKGLSIRTSFGLEGSDARYDGYTTKKYIYKNNTADVNHKRSTNIINEDIVTYDFSLNNIHSFNVMGGFTYQQNVYKSIAASGNTFLSDVQETNNLSSAGTANTPSTNYSKWVLMSYLGRINYSLLGRYLVTASFRADGSSRYSEGSRWGYFPSGAVAWRVSEEPFMKEFESISNMKLRVGYGKTGSTAIDPYMTQNLLTTGKTATGSENVPYYSPSSTYPEDLLP